MLDHAPFNLCEMASEPTGYVEDETVEATITFDPNRPAVFNYTCTDGWSAADNQAAAEVDQECVTQLPTDPEGVRACSGEPYHEDFFRTTFAHWTSSAEEYVYPRGTYQWRHKVLFNLYAFDSLRSNKTHAPTLEL